MVKQKLSADHQDKVLVLSLSWSGVLAWKMCPLSEGTSESQVIDSPNFQFGSHISEQ